MNPTTVFTDQVLYRITSSNWSGKTHLLSRIQPSDDGRFHTVHQAASYCATNILVAIAEILYHQFRSVVQAVVRQQPASVFPQYLESSRKLVIFKVRSIDDLVNAGSPGCRADYGHRIGGTGIVFPDSEYTPLRDFAAEARRHSRKGIVYPSARHSHGEAVVFFVDGTAEIREDPYAVLDIALRLVTEFQSEGEPPTPIGDVFTDRLHQTMGHYAFPPGDHERLRALEREAQISPQGLPASGYVDFVRRRYLQYPRDAVIADE